MRLDLHRAGSIVRTPEALAAIAGVSVVLLAAVTLQALGHAGPPRGMRSPAGSAAPAIRAPQSEGSRDPTPVSSAGPVDAATAYLVALGDAAERGSQQARQIADEVAVGSLRTRLESALPLVAARIRARLVATRAPAAFEGWPLGYELLTVDRSRADVSVWHLDVVASSALGLVSAEYATTTYHLRWVGGVWRIETVTSISGPTPPDPGAPPLQVDAFAREAAAFARYHYVP